MNNRVEEANIPAGARIRIGVPAERHHHPTRAARAGTPAQAAIDARSVVRLSIKLSKRIADRIISHDSSTYHT